MNDCSLCAGHNENVLWRDDHCRVVLAEEPDYPGFCRVIWHAHVAEMSDLHTHSRNHMMGVVFAVEAALREVLTPDKINLASLGNQVPHLHWHVIPRWRDDRHFPQPVWAAALRETPAQSVDVQALTVAIRAHLA